MEPSLGRPELSEMDLTPHVSENLHWLCFTFGFEKVAFRQLFFPKEFNIPKCKLLLHLFAYLVFYIKKLYCPEGTFSLAQEYV